MNWYLEIEMRHGTVEWDILKESFLLTFSFKDGFEFIDEELQEIKDAIFKIREEHVAWVQGDWSMKLRHVLECYNVTIEEGKEDPRNTNIPSSK